MIKSPSSAPPVAPPPPPPPPKEGRGPSSILYMGRGGGDINGLWMSCVRCVGGAPHHCQATELKDMRETRFRVENMVASAALLQRPPPLPHHLRTKQGGRK